MGSEAPSSTFRTLERVELALRAAEIGLWEIDDTGELRWDAHHERLAGLEPGTFGGFEHFFELVHPDDRERVHASGHRAFETGQIQGAYRVVRPDGSVRWLEGKGTIAKASSGGIVAFGITHDVTERYELEERLRQAEKLQAIGQLAGGIAHDFNNSLQVIMGYAAMLEQQLADTAHAEKLGQLRAAAARSAGLTKQLLAFGRKQALRPQTLDLHAFLAESTPRLQRLLGAHVVVSTALDASRARVKADPTQLEQIVLNLATNARDAMPGGGSFRISTANVLHERAPYVCVRFSDSGPGIDPEIRDRLFEPFFTTKEVGEGTGLGLASVYGIVEQSGGHIAVEGEPAGGATFVVCFPVAD